MQLQQIAQRQMTQQMMNMGLVAPTTQMQFVQPKPTEVIKIFWDFENCPLSTYSGGCNSLPLFNNDIQNKIDSVLNKKLGKNFVLYTPMTLISQQMQEDAIDLNIRIQPVVCHRKQESVDKVIIADIGCFASECAWNRRVGHIVLVSGDRDYSHVLSAYANKPYIGKIILIHNEQTNPKLISVADHGFGLFRDPNRMHMNAVDTEHKSNDDDDNEKKSTLSYKNIIVGGVGNSSRRLGPPPGLNDNKHKKGGKN